MASKSLPAVPARYAHTAIALHWLIALLIVCGFALGWVMTDIPGFTPTKLKYFSWHKWIGVTVFALAVVVLSAKLAKCDGAVTRAEIDAFKRQFRIPPEAVRDIGRLFDQARDSEESFEPYAAQLGASFADNRGLLEDVLTALFAIARADRAVTVAELAVLRRVHEAFALDAAAWDRARGAATRPAQEEADPYAVLGASRGATDEDLRLAWLKLVRENHPDTLASRGVPPEFVARASEKVATINAAWDRIKRERGL